MTEEHVGFLDARRIGGRHPEQKIAERPHFAAGLTTEADRDHFHSAGFGQGFQDIGRMAACGKGHKDIAFSRGPPEEPCIYFVKMVIIGDGSEIRSIDMEGFGGQRLPVEVIPAAQFGGQMLGIGGTASIPTEPQAVTGFEGYHPHMRHLLDQRQPVFTVQDLLTDQQAVGYGVADLVFHTVGRPKIGIPAGMAGHGGRQGVLFSSRKMKIDPRNPRTELPADRASRKKMVGGMLATAGYLLLFALAIPVKVPGDPLSTVLEDRNGRLLGARIAADGQWRFPGGRPVPDKVQRSLIRFEDRWLAVHPGVNPFSLARAVWTNLKAGRVRQGGSTIPMQVIRLARKGRPRTLAEKAVEAWGAMRLVFRYPRPVVLRLFADHAPFGGNVVGLEAACWRYFLKPPDRLSWAEAATLAVLPNSPALIHPGRNRSTLLEKRDRLLNALHQDGTLDDLALQTALAEPLPGAAHPLPRLAPELLNTMGKTRQGRIGTLIDVTMQERVREVMVRHHERLAGNGIRNMAVVVVDNREGAVLAYAGNAPDAGGMEGAEVDIVRAPRSPGSTLKPLLFAWALQDGILWPGTLIPDIPTQYGSYRPENFHRTWSGLTPARRAIASSLNVPMVRLLREYGTDRFLKRLHRHGFRSLNRPAEHYGLSLVLGGGEVTLWELTGAYSALARWLNGYLKDGHYPDPGGDPISVEARAGDVSPSSTEAPLLRAAAIWAMMEAMSLPDRPEDAVNWDYFASSRKVAWKTGTSFGFKDAWSVAVMPEYTIGVWVGNADAEPRADLTGIRAAAPLLFDLLELLPATTWFDPPWEDLTRTTACRISGRPPGPHCPVDTVMIPYKSVWPEACRYHQLIHLHPESGLRVSADCLAPGLSEHKAFLVLPPVEAHYYAPLDPEFENVPAWHPGCQGDPYESPFQLIFPTPDTRLVIAKDLDGRRQPVVFQATHRESAATIYWHMDEHYLGATSGQHVRTLVPAVGLHLLVLTDDQGRQLRRSFVVAE